MSGAKTSGPVYRVVRSNHDIMVLLRQFWDRDLKRPRLFHTDVLNFPWVNGCLSSHRIVHFASRPNVPPSVVKIKLVRIVLRHSDIVAQIAQIKSSSGLEEQNIGYLVVSVKPVDPTHNRFWKDLYSGQHPKYIAFQVRMAKSNGKNAFPSRPQAVLRIRVNHTNFNGYIDAFDTIYDFDGHIVNDIGHRPSLPDARLYTVIGQSADLGVDVNLNRVGHPPCH